MLRTFDVVRVPQAAASVKVARRLVGKSGWRLAYAVGSQLAGLGSPFSDVDLYLVYEGDAAPSTSDTLMADGMRVDVIPLSYDWLSGAAGAVLDGKDPAPRLPDLERLTRFALGAVVADDGRLEHLRATVFAAPSLTAELVAGYCRRVAANVENVAGFVALDDCPSAAWMADSAVMTAASAVLAAHGDAYPGLKWVVRRWRRTIGDGVDALLAHAGNADEVLERVRLAQDLVVAAISGEPPVMGGHHRRQGFDREPFAIPVPTRRGILLHQPGQEQIPISREQLATRWPHRFGVPEPSRPRAEKRLAGAAERRDDCDGP